ncbi:ATP-dependent zinc protease family protein [Legionella jordanis]|uniref:Secreted protein n=1 Tax=Legionella jordanis TaxID=456 RepID=A0A0W0VCY2_9GAMM|nr:RimK/LysX family protein [Legionella jordanis]KTD17996.1 secreted protein [Legionella jordanis]VEH13912.1 secreted protein [Legionella jordanis]
MAADQKIIYGYVEKATLVDKGMVLSAKLDTGAKSASLSAVDIHEVEKNGKPYLQFKVPGKNGEEEFTCEYVGKVKIKVRAGEHPSLQHHAEPIKRPVVLIDVKIGDKTRTIPVNLTNRKRFNYPLLLGRDAIIAFDGLVDPQHAFMIKTPKVEIK